MLHSGFGKKSHPATRQTTSIRRGSTTLEGRERGGGRRASVWLRSSSRHQASSRTAGPHRIPGVLLFTKDSQPPRPQNKSEKLFRTRSGSLSPALSPLTDSTSQNLRHTTRSLTFGVWCAYTERAAERISPTGLQPEASATLPPAVKA